MYVTHDFFIMSFAICFNIMSAIELFYLLKKKENLIFTSSIFIVISEILINIQSCIYPQTDRGELKTVHTCPDSTACITAGQI